jgi:hypothetical protein
MGDMAWIRPDSQPLVGRTSTRGMDTPAKPKLVYGASVCALRLAALSRRLHRPGSPVDKSFGASSIPAVVEAIHTQSHSSCLPLVSHTSLAMAFREVGRPTWARLLAEGRAARSAPTGYYCLLAGGSSTVYLFPVLADVKSHKYQTTLGQTLRATVPTLLILAGFLALLRFGRFAGFMSERDISLDPDLTLRHQSRAARSSNPAQVVLVGDSTCMADADAAALSELLPSHQRVLNLGLLIWFDFITYGEVLSDFTKANPGQVCAVVLLVTPDKLTKSSIDVAYWRRVHDNQGARANALPWGAPPDFFGLDYLHENLLGRVLARPLRGQGAAPARFGFSSEIEAYMTAHDGSILDMGTFVPRKPPKPGWSFAADLETQSRAFRTNVPAGAKLLIGLTPRAASSVPEGYRAQRDAMLNQWNLWIKADVLLTNLPPSMADIFFGSGQHLNEAGQKAFTAILARRLGLLLSRETATQTNVLARGN